MSAPPAGAPVPPPPSAPAAVVPGPLPPPPSPDDETIRTTLDLGRTLALVLALVAGLLFLVLLALGVVGAIFGHGYGAFVSAAYCLISAGVNYLVWRELPAIRTAALGHQYGAARDRLLVWVVLGFLFFVVDGIVLLIAWLKIDSVSHAPIVGAWAGSPSSGGTCPRCGGPWTWIPEYGRYYCYRCAAYA